jgi:hypothetical protein
MGPIRHAIEDAFRLLTSRPAENAAFATSAGELPIANVLSENDHRGHTSSELDYDEFLQCGFRRTQASQSMAS